METSRASRDAPEAAGNRHRFFDRRVLSLGFHASTTPSVDAMPPYDVVSYGGWVGAYTFLRHWNLTPVVGLGTEFNWVAHADGGPFRFELVPEARFGIWLTPGSSESKPATFPWFQLYGIAGWRFGNDLRGGAMRVGIGVQCLGFALIEFAAMAAVEDLFVPLPWTLEFTWDIQPGGPGPVPTIHLAWQF